MARFAQVAVFPHRVAVVKRVPALYTYAVPDDWPSLEPGSFVLAPFGTQSDFDRLVTGVVVRLVDRSDVERTKPLAGLLHSAPVVDAVRLELSQWLADTYLEPLSNCVRMFAPPGQTIHSDIEYALVERDVPMPNFTKTQSELIDL